MWMPVSIRLCVYVRNVYHEDAFETSEEMPLPASLRCKHGHDRMGQQRWQCDGRRLIASSGMAPNDDTPNWMSSRMVFSNLVVRCRRLFRMVSSVSCFLVLSVYRFVGYFMSVCCGKIRRGSGRSYCVGRCGRWRCPCWRRLGCVPSRRIRCWWCRRCSLFRSCRR